jgi:phosphoglycerol transferase MdoB-like AlkP superfamily enzyme
MPLNNTFTEKQVMQHIKRKLGPLYPIVVASIIILLTYSLSRLGLAIWHADRVSDANGWVAIFISGLRIDIASVCYLFVLTSLLMSLFSGSHIIGKLCIWLLRIWITIGLWIAVYMEVATPAFIIEYDLRPNRLFIEYLIYPQEVFNMLWGGYKTELFIGLIASLLTLIYGWKLSRIITTKLYYPKWYWRPAIALIVIAFGLIGARSTLGHRPLNPAMVAFSSDPLINDLTLNSSYSLAFAAKQMESEQSAYDFYPEMDKNEIISEIKASMNIDQAAYDSNKKPTLANHIATYQGQPKNIVILLLESHGARYVKSLGGEDLSPNIDKLYQEGWGFERLYATGTRSVRGIEAMTTGFSPTPARAVVKLGKSQTNFFNIADILKERQYHTQFIYGGESHFDNMKSFFLGNGFVDMQDFPTFKTPSFIGSWGACDEDLYEKADQQFSALTAQNKPFFSLVFSSSNHSPFEYPENKIEHVNEPQATRENAIKYADYALGVFVEKAKKSAYWNNTVFIAVADHDSRAVGSLAVPIGHFKIPAVIFGGGIEHRSDPRLISNIDLMPTLLSLAGISSQNPTIGHDLTQQIPVEKQRAMMQRDNNFAWMTANNDVVIFQPGEKVTTQHYDPSADTLTDAQIDPAIVKRAHANAMWGSLAFKDNLYTAQESYYLNK